MRCAQTVASLREALAALPRPLAFVPTMGALHQGHLALVRRAQERAASVAVSIFVNPLQFAPGEDFERYPRDLEGDAEQLRACGADLLFTPAPAEIYPADFSCAVEPGDAARGFEGALRPSHFRGVATVVAKLLHVVSPDVLVLGQKDAQQSAVLRAMIRDLAFPVAAEIVPTVREPDGLAMSSRNAYLSPAERAAAPSLHAALQAMLERLRSGAAVDAAREAGIARLLEPAVSDYLDCVDADSFAPMEHLRAPAFVIGAARLGRTRLIDNLMVRE